LPDGRVVIDLKAARHRSTSLGVTMGTPALGVYSTDPRLVVFMIIQVVLAAFSFDSRLLSDPFGWSVAFSYAAAILGCVFG